MATPKNLPNINRVIREDSRKHLAGIAAQGGEANAAFILFLAHTFINQDPQWRKVLKKDYLQLDYCESRMKLAGEKLQKLVITSALKEDYTELYSKRGRLETVSSQCRSPINNFLLTRSLAQRSAA